MGCFGGDRKREGGLLCRSVMGATQLWRFPLLDRKSRGNGHRDSQNQFTQSISIGQCQLMGFRVYLGLLRRTESKCYDHIFHQW